MVLDMLWPLPVERLPAVSQLVAIALATVLFGAPPGAAGEQVPPAGETNPVAEVETTQYLEESLEHRDPHQERLIREEVERAVAARLAGIPRPRYIPATDIAPPKGLILFGDRPGGGDFPFSMAIGGYLQLRWFEFARDATSWTNARGDVIPINNINSFTLNRFLISLSGHAVDERLVYSFAFFGTANVGLRSGVVPIGMAGWKFSDAATVGAGVTIVPGSREWVDTQPWTLGIDRSMANTFFRPGFSPAHWPQDPSSTTSFTTGPASGTRSTAAPPASFAAARRWHGPETSGGSRSAHSASATATWSTTPTR